MRETSRIVGADARNAGENLSHHASQFDVEPMREDVVRSDATFGHQISRLIGKTRHNAHQKIGHFLTQRLTFVGIVQTHFLAGGIHHRRQVGGIAGNQFGLQFFPKFVAAIQDIFDAQFDALHLRTLQQLLQLRGGFLYMRTHDEQTLMQIFALNQFVFAKQILVFDAAQRFGQ